MLLLFDPRGYALQQGTKALEHAVLQLASYEDVFSPYIK